MPTPHLMYSLPLAGFKDTAHAPPLPTLKALKTWMNEVCTKHGHNTDQEVFQKMKYCLNHSQLMLNFLISESFPPHSQDGVYFLPAHQTCTELHKTKIINMTYGHTVL
jgi:hypothetical protein